MVQKENTFTADEGKVFARKVDGFVMGRVIILGKNPLNIEEDDSIDNYEEIEGFEPDEFAEPKDEWTGRL